jgi:hypothetical protein
MQHFSVDLLVLRMRQLERRQEDIDMAAKALAKSQIKGGIRMEI